MMLAPTTMEDLPYELSIYILDRVDSQSLRRTSHINRYWRQVVRKNQHRLSRIEAEQIRFYDYGDGRIQVIMELRGEPRWKIKSISKTLDAEDVFAYIWPYSTKEIHLNSHSDILRDVIKSIPDYWFKTVEVLGVFANRCELSPLSLISRCPRLHSIQIDPSPHTGENVLEIVGEMNQIEEFKVLSEEKSVTVDDRCLEQLIEKSHKSDSGLRTFWVQTIHCELTLEAVLRFFENSKFASRVSILLERVIGSEATFLYWGQSENDSFWATGSSYIIRRGDSELNVNICKFEASQV